MRTKRLTKAQRDAIAYKKLRRRVADIATGAAGYGFDAEDEFATAEFLRRFIPALKVCFRCNGKAYLFYDVNLHYFHNVDTTTEWLFRSGIRAED